MAGQNVLLAGDEYPIGQGLIACIAEQNPAVPSVLGGSKSSVRDIMGRSGHDQFRHLFLWLIWDKEQLECTMDDIDAAIRTAGMQHADIYLQNLFRLWNEVIQSAEHASKIRKLELVNSLSHALSVSLCLSEKLNKW